MKVPLAISLTFLLFLASCDQNRYELGKDSSGNTVRLDRRTGEMAIVQGDQIKTLKDAAQADAERKARLAALEEVKRWEKIDVPSIGARLFLSTLWREGKMYYSFRASSLGHAKTLEEWRAMAKETRGERPKADPKKRDAALMRVMRHQPFMIELNDSNNFRIASIRVGTLTRIVGDDGHAITLEEKDTNLMTEDDYRRIEGWEITWRRSAN